MDIRRIKQDDSFVFINKKTRKRIKNQNTLKRVKSLRIPPAYKKVKISASKNSKVQAIGEDEAGRKQYIYNKDFVEEQQENKFKELIDFGRKIKRIRKTYKDILNSNRPIDNKEKQISIILFLLDVCKFRVGTMEYKNRYNTYGATTLNTEHILFKDNGEAEISFVGKKSVTNSKVIKNENVIKLLEELCNRNKGKEYLFYFKDEKSETINNINAQHITTYLKKYHKNLSPKMFRTWNGNNILIKYLVSRGKPSSEKEIKHNLRDAIKKVAIELHNTVSVAKSAYCNSEIYTTYLNDNDLFFQFIDDNRRVNGDKNSNSILEEIL